MTSRVRRAGGFALVGTLALAAPALGAAAAAPFVAVALLAAFVVTEGRLFELFARPGDHEDGQLNGLAGFALAATGLALLTTVPREEFRMPATVFATSVLVLSYGNLTEQVVRTQSDDPFPRVAGFAGGGFLAGSLGGLAVQFAEGTALTALDAPTSAFLAATGVLVAALLRTMLFQRDDPLVMLSVGLLLWGLSALDLVVTLPEIAFALGVMFALGYASYALGTASVPGMLTGVLLGMLTIVLGGLGWFAPLIAFFGIGALSTKFKYEAKQERGVAEDNDGARGTGNVLGNAAVALVAVVGYAASPQLPVPALADLFVFAFAGSLAAAMSDTLSSEIGGLYDQPRLITTFERVPPGTDGGVTWQGEIAGVVGAGLIALIAVGLLSVSPLGALVVAAGGVGGMTVDSILGATLEGDRVGNEAVNFAATLSGAVVSVLLALLLLPAGP
ncbi:DUF92 domain-containing protein [Salinirubrum litoreum]|uniref:DUF92 domain-containing protein n=1 Tax=Salinirubrum litoreum TaxID=1126234 RepID=A0ABD5RBN6_9EURY